MKEITESYLFQTDLFDDNRIEKWYLRALEVRNQNYLNDSMLYE